ncbi:hypothetical protein AHAS_Ahas17G0170500 [Arachis hypogaea]
MELQQSKERMRSLKTMSIISSPLRHIIGLTCFTLAAYRVRSTGSITKGCHVCPLHTRGLLADLQRRGERIALSKVLEANTRPREDTDR